MPEMNYLSQRLLISKPFKHLILRLRSYKVFYPRSRLKISQTTIKKQTIRMTQRKTRATRMFSSKSPRTSLTKPSKISQRMKSQHRPQAIRNRETRRPWLLSPRLRKLMRRTLPRRERRLQNKQRFKRRKELLICHLKIRKKPKLNRMKRRRLPSLLSRRN
jgi:hypothetical protein